MQSALGVSAAAAKLALNRLAKQKVIASPARGFTSSCRRNTARSAVFLPTNLSRR